MDSKLLLFEAQINVTPCISDYTAIFCSLLIMGQKAICFLTTMSKRTKVKWTLRRQCGVTNEQCCVHSVSQHNSQ